MPRAKRAKQYRKLMQKFGINFGFREPYQVIVDAELLKYANSCKMDLVKGLEQTLSGKVKPMITTCSVRHLKAMNRKEPGVEAAIQQGYSEQFERRRCGHHPEDYPEPLSALECLGSVVDPKDSGINKHRYVVASNELEVRASLRTVRGVPLIYINRSVMIMEPMAESTAQERSRDERRKLRAEIKQPVTQKRKRDDDDEDAHATGGSRQAVAGEQPKKKKTKSGLKGPNPLAVKKKKKPKVESEQPQKEAEHTEQTEPAAVPTEDAGDVDAPKKKLRKRKKKSANSAETAVESQQQDALEADASS